MAEEPNELRRICWSEAFPFIRLFSTFKRAVAFWPLMLSFCCVVSCYVSGRILDAIWSGAGAGVLQAQETGFHRGLESEIFAHAAFDRAGLREWVRDAAERWEEVEAAGADARTAEHERQRAEMLDLIEQRLETGLSSFGDDEELTAGEKAERRAELQSAADIVRVALSGHDLRRLGSGRDQALAVERVIGSDPAVDGQQRVEELGRLTRLLAVESQHAAAERLRPRGPFVSLLRYEMYCFSAAIHGVCNGRWGLSGPAFGDEPAMIGSIASAVSGVVWLVTERPWYAIVYGLVLLLVFAFFGGAICRIAAVRSAREESLSASAALRFSREKLNGLIAAPLLPAGIFIVAAVLIFVGGLIAAIPYLETVGAVLYGLALLGGVVLTFTFLTVVLGFHLMWPTIAVEGSDAFDAVQRAAGYVFQRAWHVAYYSFVLLLYGGVCFVMVRIIGMLLLKLTHALTGAGMNLASSSHVAAIGKLDGIWQMPAWQDLPLLPGVGDVSFWGRFGGVPLGGSESFAMYVMAFWVFLVVGLVGAFVISFYFCGSTEMYLLLRREVDAVEYNEIYYEEEPEGELEEVVSREAAPAEVPASPPGEASEPPAEPSAD